MTFESLELVEGVDLGDTFFAEVLFNAGGVIALSIGEIESAGVPNSVWEYVRIQRSVSYGRHEPGNGIWKERSSGEIECPPD